MANCERTPCSSFHVLASTSPVVEIRGHETSICKVLGTVQFPDENKSILQIHRRQLLNSDMEFFTNFFPRL